MLALNMGEMKDMEFQVLGDNEREKIYWEEWNIAEIECNHPGARAEKWLDTTVK